MPKVRLDEVAADAGVSKATVSMVLNNNPLVADATRARVWESIRTTGYVYNRAAASLRKQQSNAIGMIVTTLTNPYFAEVVESMQASLDSLGLDVLLGVSADDPERQLRLLKNMAGRRVDGIVMVPAQDTVGAEVDALGIPTVLMTRRLADSSADYVGGDNVSGSERITQHLISVHGAKRLAFFGGAVRSSGREERLRGFLEACSYNDIEVPAERQLSSPADRRVAREEVKQLLETQSLDAVVCYNDVTAMGVLDAAAELGMMVGRDLLVTGFDDIEDAAFTSPPLTSVHFDAHQAGERASELLLSRIGGNQDPPREVILEVRLVCRASCGCSAPGGAVSGRGGAELAEPA
jgi:LacI family transcriptional regulator, galactose operon repressor